MVEEQVHSSQLVSDDLISDRDTIYAPEDNSSFTTPFAKKYQPWSASMETPLPPKAMSPGLIMSRLRKDNIVIEPELPKDSSQMSLELISNKENSPKSVDFLNDELYSQNLTPKVVRKRKNRSQSSSQHKYKSSLSKTPIVFKSYSQSSDITTSNQEIIESQDLAKPDVFNENVPSQAISVELVPHTDTINHSDSLVPVKSMETNPIEPKPLQSADFSSNSESFDFFELKDAKEFNEIPKFQTQGFTTGNGGQISVSKASLAFAQNLFSGDEFDSFQVSETLEFASASKLNKKPETVSSVHKDSFKNPETVTSIVKDSFKKPVNSLNAKPPSGFQTPTFKSPLAKANPFSKPFVSPLTIQKKPFVTPVKQRDSQFSSAKSLEKNVLETPVKNPLIGSASKFVSPLINKPFRVPVTPGSTPTIKKKTLTVNAVKKPKLPSIVDIHGQPFKSLVESRKLVSRNAFLNHDRIQLQDYSFDGWAVNEMFQELKKHAKTAVTIEWTKNHYGLVLWKLCGYSKAYPELFEKIWNKQTVQNEIIGRYEKEVCENQRSCIKKIVERDDSPAKHMVLLVSKAKENSLELTDGWYCIDVQMNEFIAKLIENEKLVPGVKVSVLGCRLVGRDDACHVLDSRRPYLLVHGNSMRRAKRHAVCGLQKTRLFTCSLSSVKENGGIVACVDVLICKKYEVKVMETVGTQKLFYSEQEAAIQQQKWTDEYQKLVGKLVDSMMKESCSIASQEEIVLKAKEKADEEMPPRKFSNFCKFLVCDYPFSASLANECTTAHLTIWQPAYQVIEQFKEGTRVRIFNLSTGPRYDNQLSLKSSGPLMYHVLEADEKLVNLSLYEPNRFKSVFEFAENSLVDTVVQVVKVEHVDHNWSRMHCLDSDSFILALAPRQKLQALKNGSVIIIRNIKYCRNQLVFVNDTRIATSPNPHNKQEVYLFQKMQNLDIQAMSGIKAPGMSKTTGPLLKPKLNPPMKLVCSLHQLKRQQNYILCILDTFYSTFQAKIPFDLFLDCINQKLLLDDSQFDLVNNSFDEWYRKHPELAVCVFKVHLNQGIVQEITSLSLVDEIQFYLNFSMQS